MPTLQCAPAVVNFENEGVAYASGTLAADRRRRLRACLCVRMVMACPGASAAPIRVRGRSLRRRAAPRNRRRGRSRRGGSCACVGRRHVRGHRAQRRQDPVHPDTRRLRGLPAASRVPSCPQGGCGHGGNARGDDRDERRARLARALRVPRHPSSRRRGGLRRPAHAPAGTRAGRRGRSTRQQQRTRRFTASGRDPGAFSGDARASTAAGAAPRCVTVAACRASAAGA
jgi:hypothetical protein